MFTFLILTNRFVLRSTGFVRLLPLLNKRYFDLNFFEVVTLEKEFYFTTSLLLLLY